MTDGLYLNISIEIPKNLNFVICLKHLMFAKEAKVVGGKDAMCRGEA